jgi:molybdopterin-guanine dinucleotide biosynthesis protein
LPIRIIIGGPPNSGKSTLAESMARALRMLGVDAYAEDLDLASPTLEFIKGDKGWAQRQASKKEWTPELTEQAAYIFQQASNKHAVVIGDSPGKITDQSKKIASQAHYALILCRNDSIAEIKNWQAFFANIGIPIICIAVSKTTGKGYVKKNSVIKATVVGLNRVPKTDQVITTLALLIRERLSL